MDYYPRPQFERSAWTDLDGEWRFDFDDAGVGLMQKWYERHTFTQKIVVPFVFQSPASGIDDTSVHDCVWYERDFDVPQDQDGGVILHVGASDYCSQVWVNGVFCGEHRGGHTPFSFDVTQCIDDSAESQRVTMRVVDYSTDKDLPRGKQTFTGSSEGIFYTDTTGIWQSVWLEYLNDEHLESVKFVPDTLTDSVAVSGRISASSPAASLDMEEQLVLHTVIRRDAETVIDDYMEVTEKNFETCYTITDFNDHHYGYWWSPEHPNLYDVTFILQRGEVVLDTVSSYFGMRSVSIEGGKVCLNHMPFYTKSVLYQGYYPDSLLTAKSDEEIKKDVVLIKEMGFNGVRLHQKFENPRFMYWCDHLGLTVWAEAPNAYTFSDNSVHLLVQEWQEAMTRDFNHPCIMVWVPINESWGVPRIKNKVEQQHFSRAMYSLTKALDPTRLAMSNDGWEHTISDLCTVHDYEADLDAFARRYSSIENVLPGPQQRLMYVGENGYENQPVLLTEFGGIAFDPGHTDDAAWGYSGADSAETFQSQILAVVKQAQDADLLQGYCYTQFNDVEQETNGLVTMNRKPKFDLAALSEVNKRK